MKIKFLGAARAVTGSCFVIETDQARFAVDCGMHQGSALIEKRNWNADVYEAEKIDFFLITHAHIDHSGLLPLMVKNGFH
ncbi:MAG TPA: MBL fold metallo-hydrolase, partial [Smithellaceae bacterium]|nr:MBL fold metallo-hydrolase [Smithellaceae bacterium]